MKHLELTTRQERRAAQEKRDELTSAQEERRADGYPVKCVDCGRRRTCDDAGQCHECAADSFADTFGRRA